MDQKVWVAIDLETGKAHYPSESLADCRQLYKNDAYLTKKDHVRFTELSMNDLVTAFRHTPYHFPAYRLSKDGVVKAVSLDPNNLQDRANDGEGIIEQIHIDKPKLAEFFDAFSATRRENSFLEEQCKRYRDQAENYHILLLEERQKIQSLEGALSLADRILGLFTKHFPKFSYRLNVEYDKPTDNEQKERVANAFYGLVDAMKQNLTQAPCENAQASCENAQQAHTLEKQED